MLENIVDILCVNFKPNRKGTPFRINTMMMMKKKYIYIRREEIKKVTVMMRAQKMGPSRL